MSRSEAPLRVVVVGAFGRMGERVRAVLSEDPHARCVAALEAAEHPRRGDTLEDGVPLDEDPRKAVVGADVVIDFSTPEATLRLLEAAAEQAVPCVSGTTGFSATQRERMDRFAERVALLWAPNFSVAVNVLLHLTREAARRLGDGYDAEIVELHHAAKRDAPSGTALALGTAIAEARGASARSPLVLAREGETGARQPGTIGIQALRGGDNPGEHSVLFLGRGERLELCHRATTRDHFARGAVRAAHWIRGRPPGLYTMAQVLGLE